MTFEPIAIVGRACLLPGASSPDELFRNVVEARDLVTSAPEGRWGIDGPRILTPDPKQSDDRAWGDRGGYVRGFESLWNPEGFAISAAELAGLDPLVLWVLHTAREALRDARFSGDPARMAAIFGNLSFPSSSMSRHAERVWLGDELADRFGVDASDARNRFMSGLPAHLLAQALGLGAGAFALDAACASSLYAIALGCEALHDRRADSVLAGAVSRADDLFIHVGFCALGALSKSGRSRPFDRGADGLLPAEGAGFVVLKRLADALRDGDTIHGVIRGVGLSNDGRGRGMLAPSEAGQIRAMRQAYERSGVDPASVQYVECHATGTPVGDGTEIRSMKEVFGDRALPIGSLKANLGHLITAAGVAGLVKVLEAMRHGQLPPTPNLEQPNDDVAASRFRVLRAAEEWAADARGVRRAGISAFGFGGNNAHLVVESFDPSLPLPISAPVLPQPIAITGIGLRVADLGDAASVVTAIREGRSRIRERDGGVTSGHANTVELALEGLKFPPNDLKQALSQQTMLLAATRDAITGVELPYERTSILVGAQCDAEVARYGARWRTAQWAAAAGLDDGWVRSARESFVPLLKAAGVLGTMPNIPANRLNSQFDIGGPSYTVASEELSGVRALEIAIRDLSAGDLDAAIVGATDVVSETVHEHAMARVAGPARQTAGDAAVVLLLERLDDARAKGRPILAVIEPPTDGAHAVLGVTQGGTTLGPLFGDAHAATGLLHVAVAALLLREGMLVVDGGRAERARVLVEALGGQRSLVCLRAEADAASPPLSVSVPEPRLRFDAHRPRPLVPPVPAAAMRSPKPMESAVRSPEVSMTTQTMAPAPVLPKTTVDHKHVPAPAPVAHAPVAHAPVVATQMLEAPRVVPSTVSAADGFYAQLAALQAQQAQAHHEFLAAQSQLHAQYLALRQNALLGLVQAASNLGLGEVASSHVGYAESIAVDVPAQAPYVAPAPAPVAVLPAQVAPAYVAPAPAPVAAPSAVPAQVAEPVAAKGGKPRPVVLPPSTKPVTGPTFDRAALEVHAGGKISTIFGPLFEQQDGYAVQVRMPEPPLLLADRVVGLDAVAGSMGKGTVWTETDITKDKWFLHDGYTPAGILIESGQADLFLISYLGIDFLNKGERAYRLLGCELTYHGNLPTLGETIRYDIHVDGHANHGDVRIFFFHYDCHETNSGRRVISVREGQAGFFTRAELDDSAGILWRPEDQELAPNPRVDAPYKVCSKTSFSREDLERFAAGDAYGCFGAGFEYGLTHNRAPRIAAGRMLFQDAVTHFEPKGGPWKRGYLRATQKISPDDWFFDGHFKNDPCMPGTLMFEGCLGMMAFYLAALGYTVERDGWRFQPVPGLAYPLLCRGQVVPTSKELVYEIFVEEVHDGPIPTLYADLLCTVDGLKAFHARRMALQLVPDWPLTSMPDVLEGYVEPKPVAEANGFKFDYASLLACAWGRPSEAFGPMYRVFDGTRKVARLPGPPYHFMSRVTRAEGPIGVCKPGTVIEIEYDVPVEEWYFRENGYPSMPFCVFLEAALQPCGWLASYVGSALTVEDDLMFRNLDGDATFMAEVFPKSGTFRTVVKITNISQSAGMIIENFDVDCFVGDTQVYDLRTVFGFFPKAAFENQVGLPIGDGEREHLTRQSDFRVDLTERPAKYCTGTLRLPEPMLLMIDRVTAFDRTGGKNGKGFARAEKDVDPGEWFFKAHFFQDPVQPGSLGLEAMLQLLQFSMIEMGLGEGIEDARFEPIMVGRKHTWKYRGQVVPKNKLISSSLDIVEVGTDERGTYVLADASLWVDGKRIYEMKNLGMRIVSGGKGGPAPVAGGTSGKADSRPARATLSSHVTAPASSAILDPDRDTWLRDHEPTFVVPALPMMSMVDRLLGAARAELGARVGALADVQVKRWLPITKPTQVRTRREGEVFVLEAFREARDPKLSRFEAVATARVGEDAPAAALEPLRDGAEIDAPYASGTLFHGPAFAYLTKWVLGSNGASSVLDPSLGRVPFGTAHQGLLDALTHGIPHDSLHRWSDRITADLVAYPYKIPTFVLHRTPAVTGEVHVETRFDGFEGNERFPAFRIEASQGGAPLVSMRLVEILLPKGPLGSASPGDRRAFLRDRAFVSGLSLSRVDGESARLSELELRGSDWLPGTIAAAYATRTDDVVREVAAKELVAHRTATHPALVDVFDDGAIARSRPLVLHPLTADAGKEGVVVRPAGAPRLDTRIVRDFWRGWFGLGRWPVEDLYYALLERFVAGVEVADPAGLERVAGKPVLFLANHQTGIESLLFSIVASSLVRTPTLTLAKIEHRESWLGRLIAGCFAYPGARDPGVIAHFDRQDPQSLPRLVQSLAKGANSESKSLMVHVEGTRSLSCRTPITKLSGVFADLAIGAGMPVVPVRFVGGLPVEPLEQRTEFPIGYGRQTYHLGAPILPDELASLNYKQRIDRLSSAIDALGPSHADEAPEAGDAELARRVAELQQARALLEPFATILAVLERWPEQAEETRALISATRDGATPTTPWVAEMAALLTAR